jgi:NAD(P)-dependent dehydrogenase (short-subunit alcohol dehydrogenase family)
VLLVLFVCASAASLLDHGDATTVHGASMETIPLMHQVPDSASHGPSGAVVVTGGGSGIGRAAALAAARYGAAIAVLDINASAAEAVADEARASGARRSVGLRCDVQDEESVCKAIASAVEQLGPLRGLVTSAGIDRAGLVHELPLERWLEVLNTNLTGTFLACKHVLVNMLAHKLGGSIVCISSPWGDVSAPGGVAPYCASKGGVNAFVRSVALDYARHSIRVNAVVPGATETTLMWATVPPANVPAMRALVGKQLAMGRLAEPDEIAAAITWLLSDQSAYVTGSKLVIDGGLLARGSIEC